MVTSGPPNLYRLTLQFKIANEISDSAQINFGIRKITSHRDSDASFPQLGGGGTSTCKSTAAISWFEVPTTHQTCSTAMTKAEKPRSSAT